MGNVLKLKRIVLAVPVLLLFLINHPTDARADWDNHKNIHQDRNNHRDDHKNDHHPQGGVTFTFSSGAVRVGIGHPTYVRRYVPPPRPTYVVIPPQPQVYVVHVPNGYGYTPLAIRQCDNGFLGPQGEFYPVFPTVEQLRITYIR